MKEGLDVVLNFQRNEITEAQVYGFLSKLAKGENKEILNKIRNDELKHYQMWREISGQDVNINWLKVFYYSLLALIFGVTFTIKTHGKGRAKRRARLQRHSFPICSSRSHLQRRREA